MTISAIIGAGVTHKGLTDPDCRYPFILDASVVEADKGKPMSLTGANYTAAVAADGDRIVGQLFSYENRVVEGIKVGAISMCGGFEFPIKAGDTLAVGDSVVGAGNGEVKAGTDARNIVTSISGGKAVVVFC